MKKNRLKPHQIWDPQWFSKLGKYGDRIPPYILANLNKESWPLCEDFNSLATQLKSSHLLELPRFIVQEKKNRRRGSLKTPGRESIKPGGYHEYDSNITLQNLVPTRQGNWHDFFNFVIWTSFSQTKYALHRLSYHVAKNYLKNNNLNRSRINDLATLFDEGGIAIIIFDQGLYEKLITRDILSLDDIGTDHQDDIQAIIFGHALLESAFFGKWDINAFGLMFLGDKPLKPKGKNEINNFFGLDLIMSRFFDRPNIEDSDFKRASFALDQLL